MSADHQMTALPGWCCPYCGKTVGYLGRAWARLFGVGIHGCDFNLVNRAPKVRSKSDSAATETTLMDYMRTHAPAVVDELERDAASSDAALSGLAKDVLQQWSVRAFDGGRDV